MNGHTDSPETECLRQLTAGEGTKACNQNRTVSWYSKPIYSYTQNCCKRSTVKDTKL